MKLTTDQLYKLIHKSFTESPEDWSYSDHYHKFMKGIGIPYDIENKEIGIYIWIANGPSSCRISIPPKVEFNDDGRPKLVFFTATSGFKIGDMSYIKRYRLYKAAQRMVISKSEPGWDIPASKKIIRDSKINDILK
jgi:hypothetical protein